MAYEKKISRQHPGLIYLVIDDSGSMADSLPGTSDPKFAWTERYSGIILKELLARSTEMKGDGAVVKPRYYFLVTTYGSQARTWSNGPLDIEAAVEQYAQAGNALGLGGHLGGTDAEAAYAEALVHLQAAVTSEQFRDSFPPMLLHLTDGMSHTNAEQQAEQVKQLTTSDGNVLVVNAFIGTQTSLSYQGPEDFPGYLEASEAGPSPDNVRLFNMSSEAPPCIHQNLVDDGIFPNLRSGSRLFFDVRTKEMLKHVIQVVGSLGSRADREVR